MTETPATLSGGCMCGAVRYEGEFPPNDVFHCHCVDCRRSTGQPAVTFVSWNKEQVRFTGAERKIYESSPGVHRTFCGTCGTPLAWEAPSSRSGREIVEIYAGTLDDPAAVVPRWHGFDAERVPWFDIADDLPRHAGIDPDTEMVRRGPVKDGLPG